MIYVIGAGAAGTMAAITAARKGKRVALLERKDRIGKKLLATGNGCCNFTNIYMSEDNYYCQSGGGRLEGILESFMPYDAMEFFDELGVFPHAESDGRVYPRSYQASSVLDCIRNEIKRLGIEVIENTEINSIEKKGDKLLLTGSSQSFLADKAVIACGGKSASRLGSNGTGYSLLKQIGHSVTRLSPALVQLKTDRENSLSGGLKGIKVYGSLSLRDKEKEFFSMEGDILFTDYGISGPPVFQASFYFHRYGDLNISLDFLPDINVNELYQIFTRRRRILSHLSCENFLTGMINKKLGMALMKRSGVNKLSLSVGELTDKQLRAIADNIKRLKMQGYDTNGFEASQATAGGVPLCEFTENLESLKLKNIYAAGEVLDVLGQCGGYNLHFAWASGYAVGNSL